MTVLVAKTGQVYIAPLGTALPTSVTAPIGVAWKALGRLNSPGITLTPTVNSSTSNFWQDNEEFVISSGESWTIGWEMSDWNIDTINLYFNPSEIDTTEGSFIVGSNSEQASCALFIVFTSGVDVRGIGVPDFQITEKSALSLISTDKLSLPVTGRPNRNDGIGGFMKFYDPQLIDTP